MIYLNSPTASGLLGQKVSSVGTFGSDFSTLTLTTSSFRGGLNGGFLVQFVQSDDVELGLLEGLDLLDDGTTQRIDELASLGDELGELVNVVQLSNEVRKVGSGGFLGDDFNNLLSDGLDLLLLSVRGLSGLSGLLTSEGDNEDSEDIAVLGLNFTVSINEGLPLSDELAELVSGHIHSVEVGEASFTLDVFNAELDLSPSILVVVQISEGRFDDSAL